MTPRPSATGGSTTGALLPLLRRRARVDAPGLTVIVLLAVVLALAVGLVPRALDAVAAQDLRDVATQLATAQRDVTGVASGFPADLTFPLATRTLYTALDDTLAGARMRAQQPLRAAMRSPSYVVRTTESIGHDSADLAPLAGVRALAAAADPRYLDRIRFVSGAAPQTWVLPALGRGSDLTPVATAADPIEIAVSADAAAAMKLRVGDLLDGPQGTVRISGLFRPVHPDDGYWQHAIGIRTADISTVHDTRVFSAAGFVAPATMGSIALLTPAERTDFWWPVDADAVTVENARAMSSAVHRFNDTVIQIPIARSTIPLDAHAVSSLGDAIDDSLGRWGATVAVLSLCLTGPLGAAVAVFALAVQGVMGRRDAASMLAASRGASRPQLMGLSALEGLVLGVPAAAAGAAVAALILPGQGGAAAWLLPGAVGLAPPVLFALGGARRHLVGVRRDVSARAGGRARLAFELGTVVIAAGATTLIVRRGPLTSAGFDPLLALTPLLLALVASLVVLRLLPLVLAVAHGAQRRRDGIVAFVGSARAMRDPVLGVAVSLALVVGISAAVFSTAVLTTVSGGATATARAAVGADIRAESLLFRPADERRVIASSGVDSVVALSQSGPFDFGLSASTQSATVVAADAAALHRQRPEIPADLAHEIDGRIPVLVSSDLADDAPPGSDRVLGSAAVRVIGELPADAGLGADSSWVLVDARFVDEIGPGGFTPETLLIDVTPGGDVAKVAAEVRRAVPSARVQDVSAAVAAIDDTPSMTGLRVLLTASAVAGVLLAAIAVFAGSLSAAVSRNRAIGLLRTMGLSARQSLGVVAWELVPAVVVATLVGAALGIALPWLVVATTDLGPFVGGATPSTPYLEPLPVALALIGFLVASGVAVALAVLAARRTSPATSVKMGEE